MTLNDELKLMNKLHPKQACETMAWKFMAVESINLRHISRFIEKNVLVYFQLIRSTI